ncbi:hypothetical protein, conserved [Babesia ovata]|uniref:C3H1-type domain-containing protein n=1 Tax=Babesia ovata TaxID=189622 RepID=A0A2H6KK32_9APIC|nr:uncharacterized protein BOVATA_048350 [Babesia ovata]GBE63342.1 hypothetical protein, conserved [Babesia ovata]
MSFILECLVNSRDILWHYHKPIDDVIRDLKGSIGKGHDVQGFGDAIGIVQQGLQGYEGGMDGRIERFESPLKTLPDSFQELRRYLNDVKHKNLSVQLSHVAEQASSYYSKSKVSEKVLETIDTDLRGKLDKHVSLVVQAAETFKGVNGDEQLKEQAKQVDAELEERKAEIISAIEQQSKSVQGTVAREINKIKVGVKIFKMTTLKTQIERVRTAVERASEAVEDVVMETFDEKYISKISDRYNKCKEEVVKFTNPNGLLLKCSESVQQEVAGLENIIMYDLQQLYRNIKVQFDAYIREVYSALNAAGEGRSLLFVAGSMRENSNLARWIKGYVTTVTGVTVSEPDKFKKALEQLGVVVTVNDKNTTAFDAFSDDVLKYIGATFLGAHEKVGRVEALMRQYAATKDTLTKAIIKIKHQITLLQNVPNSVIDGHNAEARCIMETLKHDIESLQAQILDVGNILQEAHSTLITSVDCLIEAVDKSHIVIHDETENVKKSLLAAVKSSFDNVKNSVHSLFAKQKQAELATLEKIVAEQLATIERIINDDKARGVKGFLGELQLIMKEKFLDTHLSKDMTLHQVAGKVVEFLEPLFDHVVDQLKPKTTKNSLQPLTAPAEPPDPNIAKVENIKRKVYKLLLELKTFNHNFATNVASLLDAVYELRAVKFGDGKHPDLLNIIKTGIGDFGRELNYAYVNTYSGVPNIIWEQTPTHAAGERDPTEDSMNCAKTFCTIVSVLYTSLQELRAGIESRDTSWSSLKINSLDYNDLGAFLQRSGFRVASHQDISDGELRNDSDMVGGNIFNILLGGSDKLVYNSDKTRKNALETLYSEHLQNYYNAGHHRHISNAKSPCSIFEMLCWLTALPHNRSYTRLTDHIKKLFADDYSDYAYKIYDTLAYDLPDICNYSHDLLTTIVGHGDECATYASDFYNNVLDLSYPGDPSQCLDLFLDILRRLFPVLKFLYERCRLNPSCFGWRYCDYGRDVMTSKWPCSKHSTSESNCQAKCQANGQPNTQPVCQPNDKPNCQPRSPLMSYLNDCLPGHLPHDVSSIGCRSVCSTCPNGKKGMPCLTPLGFRAFSGSTKTGKNLSNLLHKFFAKVHCSPLFCLVPKAPTTLPEHFSYALSLVNGLNIPKPKNIDNVLTLPEAFKKSVAEQSINLYSDTGKLIDAINNAYGHCTAAESECDNAHLINLTSSGACNNNLYCAPYISTLSYDTYKYMTLKHSKTYLSWAIYLPWTFWDLLNNLYNAFCSINCRDWGCRGCLRGRNCKNGKHGLTDEKSACNCSSIVECKGVSPTLYQYGFSFKDPLILNDGNKPKRCSDFCTQLKRVLDSQYFTDLFEKCDEFIWAIRTPFSYLLLALWSLSLLYLLHIAVVRLDVLRIRSHLRSPASHRIAAQSLLAVANVGKIANVKYFSP